MFVHANCLDAEGIEFGSCRVLEVRSCHCQSVRVLELSLSECLSFAVFRFRALRLDLHLRVKCKTC